MPISLPWVEMPEQRGFGIESLATIIGETGDLGNYPNPGNLWARMGCAPFQSNGKAFMGATWKAGKEGKLSGEEWTQFGYSPRRRSVAYVIGENLVKQNATGPYRARYNGAKAAAAESHTDWKPLRCHRHAMLLATKLLLKNLCRERHGCGDISDVTECSTAAVVPARVGIGDESRDGTDLNCVANNTAALA